MNCEPVSCARRYYSFPLCRPVIRVGYVVGKEEVGVSKSRKKKRKAKRASVSCVGGEDGLIIPHRSVCESD